MREKHLLNARLTAACQVESLRSEGGKTHVPLSDRTLDQNMVLEFTPIPTGHSTAPQSQRYQSTSAGHGTQTQTHPSMHREGARLFSRAQGQLSESHDRSATEDVPSILPNKIGQQSSAETRPNRSDPQHESRAQEDRWSVRQSVSQRTCPPPSSSFCSYGDESMADFNVSARESFASDSISRTRGQRDIDRDGPVQERAMTSSEFVKYVKARRKVNQ